VQVLLSGVAAGLSVAPASNAPASDKMTREQASYQDYPQGIYSCALCSLFEPPKFCKVVKGEVSKDGGARPSRLPTDLLQVSGAR
jgi:hypothetical protein